MSSIIIDTREKNPFDLFPHKTIRKSLPCGDYTTNLLLGVCAVERKATTAELCLNLGKAKAKARFFRELDKLAKLPHPLILCEFPESYTFEFPINSGIPEFRYASPYEVASGKYERGQRINAWEELRIGGKRLRSLVHEVEAIVPVVFCPDRRAAERYLLTMFEELEHGL